MADLPSDDVLRHVVDVHCHPSDAPQISPEAMDQLQITVCAMASRESDQPLVRNLATSHPSKVIPCFGYHPWFSHFITTDPTISKEEHYNRLFLDHSSEPTSEQRDALNVLLGLLPTPRLLVHILDELRQNLAAFPHAMLGEVGLDRSFHVPYNFDASPRRLTPFTVPLDHQLVILEAQLDIAIELGRNASIHSVKSQQATIDLLSRLHKKHGDSFYRISIDMHSCGFSPETWKSIETKYTNVFLSLSMVINQRHSRFKALIDACADDRILVESDYNDINMSTSQTWKMLTIVAEVKKWSIETAWPSSLDDRKCGAVRHFERNWERFCRGDHTPSGSRRSAKRRRNDNPNSSASSPS
ncbi:hypothetical protein AGABI2DRAFT_189440 [Agaricus bisporus var. bisporus H97]|uniref:hypothetical protein n=1 Tax=Agaricus bisporus var. bisporus (strain H97 / ATCC MYA-4626 / FGSC 10389) TaxID=936046 RepID=UPI00029F6B25|nr:hypothetical protein AGABI2DRAFT_189440 [Agaricus bisporus var. bisporus H97]EKV51150.1 hypothetical protein AGABI2DRAFT_189440 [Agaricus bisporus var. bisporus H97]